MGMGDRRGHLSSWFLHSFPSTPVLSPLPRPKLSGICLLGQRGYKRPTAAMVAPQSAPLPFPSYSTGKMSERI